MLKVHQKWKRTVFTYVPLLLLRRESISTSPGCALECWRNTKPTVNPAPILGPVLVLNPPNDGVLIIRTLSAFATSSLFSPAKTVVFFECFSYRYVCPEPVLLKRCMF